MIKASIVLFGMVAVIELFGNENSSNLQNIDYEDDESETDAAVDDLYDYEDTENYGFEDYEDDESDDYKAEDDESEDYEAEDDESEIKNDEL